MLAAITLNLKADYANDALELSAFLAENRQTPPDALKEYARADFMGRQHRNSEGISLYRHVAATYPAAPLADDALMNVALLQAKSGLFDDAVATYEKVIVLFKEHGTLLDRAQYRIGEICQYGLRDVHRAITAYETLLAEYPRSVFADEARKRIRQLRGGA
jgi:TolA-binding protein